MIQYLIDSDIPIRLACLSTSDWPAVVSLWYVYSGEKFYCATQNTAKIVKYLRCSPKCGLQEIVFPIVVLEDMVRHQY
jgi:nitroimidazol reductase NimA-like FMN-containing flavoprotein (pyridoxamine 5'-phosphate oxidase superfamily)